MTMTEPISVPNSTQNSAVVINTRSPGVTEVVLNRPEKRNAFDDVIIGQLIAAFEQIGQDSDTNVVVLRSEGKHFSAGAWPTTANRKT
jgi:methylglutaconyl-CoA hydratase